MKRVISIILITVFLLTALAGCNQAERVSMNLSKEADNFNVYRRLVVINAMDGIPLFECLGYFSFSLTTGSSGGNERIAVTIQTGPNEYKKHSVGIGTMALWVVEDLGGASVSPYHYEINFLPEMILPFTITSSY